METLISLLFVAVGFINGLPLFGVLSTERLASLYGVAVTDANLAVLLRHRAVLFGILGAFLLAAAFVRAWQAPALAAGLLSMVAFAALTVAEGELNGAMKTVLRVDLVGIALGTVAAGLLALR